MIVPANLIPPKNIHEISGLHVAIFKSKPILVSLRDLAIGLGCVHSAVNKKHAYYTLSYETFSAILRHAGVLKPPTDVIHMGMRTDFYVPIDAAADILNAALVPKSGQAKFTIFNRKFFRERLFLPVMFKVIDIVAELKKEAQQ